MSLLDYLKTPPEIKGLGAINKYLATRADLLPKCNICERPVESMRMWTSSTLRFSCHNQTNDIYIPRDIVSDQDRMYKFLGDLPKQSVFIKPPPPPPPPPKRSFEFPNSGLESAVRQIRQAKENDFYQALDKRIDLIVGYSDARSYGINYQIGRVGDRFNLAGMSAEEATRAIERFVTTVSSSAGPFTLGDGAVRQARTTSQPQEKKLAPMLDPNAPKRAITFDD